MNSLNLVCLPYAGGNTYSYNAFGPYLDSKLINIITPELPGRGEYYGEPLLTDVYAIAGNIFTSLLPILHQPYAFYGHSMGGILGYLLSEKITKEQLPPPVHFFCSGCKAPSIPNEDEFHKLSIPAFIDKLRELGGSPEEILNNKDVMDFLLPVIRADFEAAETYAYRQDMQLNVPITVLIGDEDKVSHAEAVAWQKETKQPVNVLNYTGGHFFIFEHAQEICREIMQTLNIL